MQLSSKTLDTVIRFLFNPLIVRKIGISREVIRPFFLHIITRIRTDAEYVQKQEERE